jgi:tetratricopeptide (TPR) repeat protein
LLDAWSTQSEQEAEQLFISVIADMPKFASAYSSLAGVYNVQHLINTGSPRDANAEKKAMSLAQKSVDIDPLDTRGHLTLAWSYCMARQYERAELHYDLACELNPYNPRTLISAAQGLAFVGSTEKAAKLCNEAMELAPFLTKSQWAYIASVRFITGEYQACLEASQVAADSIGDVDAWQAAALVHLGMTRDAREVGTRLVKNLTKSWINRDRAPRRTEIVSWLLDCYPIKPGASFDRLREALSIAIL